MRVFVLGPMLIALALSRVSFGLTSIHPKVIRMGINSSRSIKIPKLNRIAVGNSQVVKARAISNSELFLIGKKRGETRVTTWNEQGEESNWEIRVIASEAESSSSNIEREVVKVSLEFLELNEALAQVSGFRWPESIQFSNIANLISNGGVTGLNYQLTFTSAQGWLHHLVREGWAKVVAKPELYVRLGEEAVFHSGGEFPVATSVENYGKAYRHIEWKNYGLTAKVLPQSLDQIHISSSVNLEISELISSQNIDGIPALTRRSLKTKINSLEGETVILSGLVKQNTKREKDGLPFLSSIPLLGSLLFTKSSEGSDQTELLMAVTFEMSTQSREREKFRAFENKTKRFN